MLYDEKWDRKTEVDEVGKLLLRAVDIIEYFGWRQHEMGNVDEGFCAIGAIGWAEETWRGGLLDSSTGGLACNRLAEFVDQPVLAWWNDHPRRTKEEVIEALRGAANAVR